MTHPAVFHNPDVAHAVNALRGKKIRHVFYVACGGSLAVMYPAKYFLDSHSAQLPSDCYNADEFVLRAPKSLNNDSLVILCSQTGTTNETVQAAEFARQHGAITVGLTVDRASPLAQKVDYPLIFEASYTTGIPIDAINSNYSLLYQLNAGLLSLFDKIDITEALNRSLQHLQPAIDAAQRQYDALTSEFAKKFCDEKVIYTLASGADYGASYSYAICVLMEMQWIHSQAIHAGEFFHGPFEVVDQQQPFILMLGLDATRPMEERAQQFLNRYGNHEKVLTLDAKTLDLSGIDPVFQGNLVPLIFFEILWRFAYKLADLRHHVMLQDRRYMKKVAY